MARDFGGDLGSARVQVADFAAMRNLDTLTTSQWLFRTGADACRLWQKGNVGVEENSSECFSGGVDFVALRWNTTIGFWIWNTVPPLNTWENRSISYDYSSTANVPTMYVDGVNLGAPDGSTQTPVGTPATRAANDLRIGNSSDVVRAFDGRLAEFGLWDVILTSGEIKSLAAGISPLRVRPGSLLLYVPIQGIADPEPNYTSAGGNGTVTGTTFANHAPVAPPFGVDSRDSGRG